MTISISSSSIARVTKEILREHKNLHRSHSVHDLYNYNNGGIIRIRSSYSDHHHLYYSITRTQSRLMNIPSAGKDVVGEGEGEGEDGVCELDYGDDDDYEEEDGTSTYNRESFSRLLSEVDWSDTKLFSQLAFLCNMAYAIPELKAKDLRMYYRLRLVTSSLEKKADAAASLHSSPCEWFVCDDFSTYTRCFIIQGLDSVASWHAYLFFEPTKFEGTDVVVHRGIYEAAKGIYEQFMQEIMEHLNTFGDRAKLQFSGHSLGGSLALIVSLMLLARQVVKPSALRPIVTFGSPSVFCGGQKILEELGLDENHVQCVMMHRDVVPRAFSCIYPNYVAQLLKPLSATFRSHPCLNKNKLLYSQLGKIYIIQPDEKSSPPHPLLPPGSALYSLDNSQCGSATKALRAFLNSPHPLETLSDPTAYGSEGTILRDHDSSNYLKAVNGVLRQYTRMVVGRVKKRREPFVVVEVVE